MKVDLVIRGADRLRVRWERAGRRAAEIAESLLQVAATRIRSEARRKLVEFGQAAEARRREADAAMGRTQTRSSRVPIASTVWEKRVNTRSRSVAAYHLGWGKRYGPVLEWGPQHAKSGWWITPGKTSPFLRWYDFGAKRVMYSRTPVWHPWSDKQLRPHFAPAYDTVWPGFLEDMARIPEKVL